MAQEHTTPVISAGSYSLADVHDRNAVSVAIADVAIAGVVVVAMVRVFCRYLAEEGPKLDRRDAERPGDDGGELLRERGAQVMTGERPGGLGLDRAACILAVS